MKTSAQRRLEINDKQKVVMVDYGALDDETQSVSDAKFELWSHLVESEWCFETDQPALSSTDRWCLLWGRSHDEASEAFNVFMAMFNLADDDCVVRPEGSRSPQQRIYDQTDLRKENISRAIKKLYKIGFVEKHGRDPSDLRLKLYRLTTPEELP